jgi:hypothetical protein
MSLTAAVGGNVCSLPLHRHENQKVVRSNVTDDVLSWFVPTVIREAIGLANENIDGFLNVWMQSRI